MWHCKIDPYSLFLNILIAFYICTLFDILAPPPAVSITNLNNQTVGQSLILQCEVTTVRININRVDIVWSSDGKDLKRMNNVSSTTVDNSLVYTNSFTISQLNTTDDDRVIQCEGVINANPLVMVNDNIILNVTGEYPY